MRSILAVFALLIVAGWLQLVAEDAPPAGESTAETIPAEPTNPAPVAPTDAVAPAKREDEDDAIPDLTVDELEVLAAQIDQAMKTKTLVALPPAMVARLMDLIGQGHAMEGLMLDAAARLHDAEIVRLNALLQAVKSEDEFTRQRLAELSKLLADDHVALIGQDRGEIAYNAYGDTVGWKTMGGTTMPSWADQKPHLRLAWSAAGNAAAAGEIAKHGLHVQELRAEIARLKDELASRA